MKMLGVSKSKYYYTLRGAKTDEAALCAAIDREHLEHSGKGVIQMRDFLVAMGITIGVKRTRRLMRQMEIEPFYSKPILSKLGRAKYVHSYLLRGKPVNHCYQVWSTDITYILMPKGFLYPYAIIVVYSWYVVGWGLYSTLEAANAVEVLNQAIGEHGRREVINSNQGNQYTCPIREDTLKELSIAINMVGRGHCRDNARIEPFWRTLKVEYVYLNTWGNVGQIRGGIAGYIDYYNNRRHHSSIGHITLATLYSARVAKVA